MDILEALAATPNAASTRKCKVQRWLDDIPEDQPGKAELVSTVITTDPKDEGYRTLEQVEKLVFRLGLATSIKSIGDHRAGRCRCGS